MPEQHPALQARLTETERRLELALAASRMGVWEWDLAGNRVVWSPECYTITGLADFDGTLDGFLRLVHPEDAEPLMAASEAAVAGHSRLHHEFRLIRPDGTTRWVVNIGQADYDESGRPIRFVGTVRDITEERRGRSALREAATTFQQLANQLPYCLWTAGPDGAADFINQHALDYHRLPFEQLRGRLGERVHPEDRAAYLEARRDGQERGVAWGTRARFLGGDGGYRWFKVQATPALDADGAVTRWVGTLTDVDDETRLGGQVVEERQRLTAIADVSPGVICSLRRSPDGRFGFPYASSSITQLYGMRPEELREDAALVLERIHPGDMDGVLARITDSARDLTAFHAEWRYAHPTRGTIWVECNSMPAPDPDGGITWHGVVTDISERKRLERQLRLRSDALETSPIGYGIITHDAHFIYANPAFARMWGYDSPDDLIGMSPVALCVDPETPGRCIADVNLKGACRSEFTARRRDGSTFEVRMQLSRSVGEEGDEIYVGSAVDITEEKRAEATIRQWADAFHHAGHGIAMGLPGSNSILACNPAFARLVGREPEEVQGLSVPDLFPPEEHATVLAHIEEANRTGHAHYETRILRPDGILVNTEIDLVSVRGEDAELRYRIATLQDITARKRADESLRAVRDHLQAVDRASPLPIVALSPAGTVFHWNRAAEALFGWRAEEVLGRQLPIVPPDKDKEYATFRTRVLSGRSFTEVSERIARDGRRIPVRISTSPLHDETGARIGLVAVYVDLTEHRALESALRASEQRFSQAFQSSPVASVLIRVADRNIVEVNEAMVELSGYGRGELIGRTTAEFPGIIPGELREEAWRQLHQYGHLPPFDHTITRPDGTQRHINARAGRLMIGGEEMVLAVVVDITARTRAEAALRDSENRLRLFIEHAPAALAMFDREMRYVSVSRRWLVDHKLTDRTLIGRSHYEVIPEIPDRWREIHRRGLAGEVIVHEGDRFERADGSVQWLRWEVRPWHDAGGTVGGILIFTEDITASLEARNALGESEARFRQLAESIHEVFWLTDVDKGVLVYLSPGYEAIWGRSCQTVYDNPRAWLEAIHPDDRERVLQAALTKQVDGTYDEEYRIVRPDGSVRWVRDQAFPVRDESGTVIRVAGVAEDITERRQLETQFRQTQKMESIGLLAGGVAHDFNNWLTVIAGCTELLQENVGADADSAELLNEVRHASERATALTRQLLAFSRREVVEPRVLDINDVIRDTEKMLRRLLGEDVMLETALSTSLDPVRVDAGQWTQVLMNLAVNARDAMPRGGRLTMDTREVMLDSEFVRTRPGLNPGRYIVIGLSDTGSGMTPEVRARVFEPFFTTKSQGRGTGLGLAVVHGIVTQSGGTIEVYSEPGVGTTFRIYLPTVASSTPAPLAPSPGGDVRGTETVMVVEDEESIRRMITHGLRSQGYSVIQAIDGEDALAVLHRHGGTIDLLVTDVVMPRMDGRALAEALKTMLPKLKVIYTSGYTDDAVVRHGILQSEVAFVSKPYTPMTLLRRIRQVLDSP